MRISRLTTQVAGTPRRNTPNFKIQEHVNDFADMRVKRVAPGPSEVVDGHFALPTAPGLGVRPDLDALAESPRERVFATGRHLRDRAVT